MKSARGQKYDRPEHDLVRVSECPDLCCPACREGRVLFRSNTHTQLYTLKGQSHEILQYFLLNSSLNLYFLCSLLWFSCQNFVLFDLKVIKRFLFTSMEMYTGLFYFSKSCWCFSNSVTKGFPKAANSHMKKRVSKSHCEKY